MLLGDRFASLGSKKNREATAEYCYILLHLSLCLSFCHRLSPSFFKVHLYASLLSLCFLHTFFKCKLLAVIGFNCFCFFFLCWLGLQLLFLRVQLHSRPTASTFLCCISHCRVLGLHFRKFLSILSWFVVWSKFTLKLLYCYTTYYCYNKTIVIYFQL